MRIVRTNPDRDESKAPSLDDCLAHRCEEHKDIPLLDDSVFDGSECGVCMGHKFLKSYEEPFEKLMLDALFWPMVEIARTRLNLLSLGSGEVFVDEARARVDTFNESREPVEGHTDAENRHPAIITTTADPGNRPGS